MGNQRPNPLPDDALKPRATTPLPPPRYTSAAALTARLLAGLPPRFHGFPQSLHPSTLHLERGLLPR
ncbi:hypothetical protein KCP78_08730 [Salmonella enterica subsp. enterica]|nr:hypothetical protein KCP78_08730 [Salmonella enterica subsp. enterica]